MNGISELSSTSSKSRDSSHPELQSTQTPPESSTKDESTQSFWDSQNRVGLTLNAEGLSLLNPVWDWIETFGLRIGVVKQTEDLPSVTVTEKPGIPAGVTVALPDFTSFQNENTPLTSEERVSLAQSYMATQQTPA